MSLPAPLAALSRNDLVRLAIALWHASHQSQRSGFAASQPLKDALPHPLRDSPLTDSDTRRRPNALGWHNDRGTLRRLLDAPRLEPLNNRAKRALRPAGPPARGRNAPRRRGERRRLRRSPT